MFLLSRTHRIRPHGGSACWTYRPVLSLLLILSFVIGALPHLTLAAPSAGRVLPQLQQEAAARPDQTFRVIIKRHNQQDGGDRAVRAAGGKKLKDLPHDAFVAKVPGRAIAALGRNPAVNYVSIDARMNATCMDCSVIDTSKLATLYPRANQITDVWPSANSTGWTGKGIGIAIIDTGIERRPDFNNAQGTSRIVAHANFSSGQVSRDDGHGHGTHVAGILAGNSWHRTEPLLQGRYIGVAPEANLINLKVADDFGGAYLSDVVMAIDWVVANRESYNIRVMNLSLVSSVAESYKTSILAAAVQRAWFNGILVVVAAGNAGPDSMFYPPANDPFVITVGAADANGTAEQHDDFMAPWSSYGTTQDGFSKPDVVATGRFMVAPLAPGSSILATRIPWRIVNGDYLRLSGTSMSAPVIAGLGALAFQARPELTNDQVKWLLMQTATRLGSTASPILGQGAGTVNATALLRYSGVPDYANQGIEISEHLVGPEGWMIYDSNSLWKNSLWKNSLWKNSLWKISTNSAHSVSCELECDGDIENTEDSSVIAE
jgi:serine protease AprX